MHFNKNAFISSNVNLGIFLPLNKYNSHQKANQKNLLFRHSFYGQSLEGIESSVLPWHSVSTVLVLPYWVQKKNLKSSPVESALAV